MSERLSRGGLAILSAVFVIALLVWVNIAYSERVAVSSVQLSSVVETGLSDAQEKALAAELAATLSSAPINQDLLSEFTVLLGASGASPKKMNQAYEVLANLGWRSTSAQQNLIAHALVDEDFSTIIERSDGLLRRGKFSNEIFVLLLTVEQSPGGRVLLAETLQKHPRWSSDFFRRGGNLNTEEGLLAHAALMNGLLDAGYKLGRFEVVPWMNRMVRQGLLSDAYEMFERLTEEEGPDLYGLFDPDFRIAAIKRPSWVSSYPFEWNVTSSRGIYSRVDDRGSSGRLNLKWNGRGHPLLLAQLFRTGELIPSGVRVTGLGNDGRLLNSLQFFISCADRSERRILLEATPDSSGDVIYRGDFPSACAFMKLEVFGLSEVGGKPVDIHIGRIDLE